MKKQFFAFAFILLAAAPFTVQAQSPEEFMRTLMVKDWERAKKYTSAYLDAMPADKYSTRATDSVRTFSQQMLHLAMVTIRLSASGTGAERIFPGFNMEKSSGAQSKDSVAYYVNASYDFAINSIKNMDVTKLGETVNRFNKNESRISWLMKAFEHQTHHRGQCTIYIRLQGVTPPNEMLF